VKRLSTLSIALAVLVCAPARAADEPPAPVPATIPEGVVIGQLLVGGMTPETAAEQVRANYALPLILTYGSYVFEASPESLAVPAIQKAVEEALAAAPGTIVSLQVTVRRDRVRGYAGEVAERFARAPVDARLFLRKNRPWIAREKPGREIDRTSAERAITSALQAGVRGPVRLRQRVLRPRITFRDIGPVIVIRRGSNKLYLYNGMRYWKLFPVATGQTRYPTPLGRFHIVVKWKNPWWYPPDSDWAKDKEPVPPGPSNPLGTRWMGISSPGVGIHGTPEPGSLGYSVSHGCIRMRITDAEWLFEHVAIGTPVFIVSA
jgi:lipoprotein-anchoring transpeptidase ErfK/SrfK